MEEKKLIIGNVDSKDREQLDKAICYRDDRFAVIDNIQRISTDYAVRLEAFVVVLCLKGRGVIYVDDETCEISADDLVVCRPSVIVEHGMVSVDFECCGCCLSPEYLEQLNLIGGGKGWDARLFLEKHTVLSLKPEEARLFVQYMELFRSKFANAPCRHHRELVDCLLQAFMYEFYDVIDRFVKAAPVTYSSAENLFKEFAGLLSSSYPKSRSVSFYADRLNVTPKYLSAVCKEVSRQTASELINRCVMKDVEYLMKRTRKSIKEISNELDFPNLSFFGKYVKRYWGMSPKQYREQCSAQSAGGAER